MRLVSRFSLLAALSAIGTSSTPAEENSQEACILTITLWQQQKIVGEFGRDSSIFLVVNERMWDEADYVDKVKIAETFDCAVAGPGKTLADFEIRGSRTNHVVGLWRWGKLKVP